MGGCNCTPNPGRPIQSYEFSKLGKLSKNYNLNEETLALIDKNDKILNKLKNKVFRLQTLIEESLKN